MEGDRFERKGGEKEKCGKIERHEKKKKFSGNGVGEGRRKYKDVPLIGRGWVFLGGRGMRSRGGVSVGGESNGGERLNRESVRSRVPGMGMPATFGTK